MNRRRTRVPLVLTSPLPEKSYRAWASSYKWKTMYGIEFLYAGPLFIHQLSHVWIDCRGVRDPFMRQHGLDYFENSRRATLVQQQYAIRNPRGFAHYDQWCWGVTASDGPGPSTLLVDGVERRFYDYIARGAPYGPDDGTLAPWAVVASLPFAPDVVLPTLENVERMRLNEAQQYGYKASFNPVGAGVDADAQVPLPGNRVAASRFHRRLAGVAPRRRGVGHTVRIAKAPGQRRPSSWSRASDKDESLTLSLTPVSLDAWPK